MATTPRLIVLQYGELYGKKSPNFIKGGVKWPCVGSPLGEISPKNKTAMSIYCIPFNIWYLLFSCISLLKFYSSKKIPMGKPITLT
jgi:hypothetical protein